MPTACRRMPQGRSVPNGQGLIWTHVNSPIVPRYQRTTLYRRCTSSCDRLQKYASRKTVVAKSGVSTTRCHAPSPRVGDCIEKPQQCTLSSNEYPDSDEDYAWQHDSYVGGAPSTTKPTRSSGKRYNTRNSARACT